jgi:hypothetical protein
MMTKERWDLYQAMAYAPKVGDWVTTRGRLAIVIGFGVNPSDVHVQYENGDTDWWHRGLLVKAKR